MDLFDYAAAQAAALDGMTRAVDRADRERPGWSEEAFDALLAFAATADADFTAERARAACHDAGLPVPPDARAWGAVFKRASGKGHIVRVGYAPRACGNNTPAPLWRSA